MKRVLTILTALVWAWTASAQMMPDSTVQVCAYWEVGDKYHFQVEESKYKVDNQTDTSAVELSAHLLTLEVVDATDSTYRVRVKTDDYQHSNYARDAMTENLTRQFGNLPYEFETNEYGEFKRILLSDEELEAVYPLLDAVADKSSESRNLDENGRAAVKQLMRAMFTRERIVQLYEQEVTPLLGMFGIRVTPDEKVDYQMEVPSPFGDGSLIVWNGAFWADKELTDDYSVVMVNEAEADGESMRKYLAAFLGTMFNALGDKADENLRTETEAMVEGDTKISLTESTVEEIHLDTGWPLSFDYERVLRIKAGDTEREQVQTKTITILLEDDEGQVTVE